MFKVIKWEFINKCLKESLTFLSQSINHLFKGNLLKESKGIFEKGEKLKVAFFLHELHINALLLFFLTLNMLPHIKKGEIIGMENTIKSKLYFDVPQKSLKLGYMWSKVYVKCANAKKKKKNDGEVLVS